MTSRNRFAVSGFLSYVFYSLGLVLAVACLVMVLAGNTDLVGRLNHTSVPLSWLLGIGSILAFVAFEYLESDSAERSETNYLEFSMEAAQREPELS